MIDEGYIKFRADWQSAPPLPADAIRQINHYRQRFYDRQLIGAYPNGTGYGNISCRYGKTGQFLISGSKTGNFPVLDATHYSLVTEVRPAENYLRCEGPVVASSESMSHAVVYECCPEVQAVIHIHHLDMWQQLMNRVPTTVASAAYGSPEMVESIRQLLRDTNLREQRIFVMQGHEEGVFAFGESFEVAEQVIYRHLQGG